MEDCSIHVKDDDRDEESGACSSTTLLTPDNGGGNVAPNKCPSSIASSSGESVNQDICRICHWEGDGTGENALVAPCYCSGSLRWVHQHCLQQWIRSSDITCCELCKYQFVMNTKVKSFSQWELLQMTGVEKRKLIMSVIFHWIALICVMWSLYVLVERTAEELHRGDLEWPFWSKLIVVAFGFFGGLVFVYIQCKAYVNLCRRWRSFNRVIYIQNAPEKPAMPLEPTPAGKKSSPPLKTLVFGTESTVICNLDEQQSSPTRIKISIADNEEEKNTEDLRNGSFTLSTSPKHSPPPTDISTINFNTKIKTHSAEIKTRHYNNILDNTDQHHPNDSSSSSENEETLHLLAFRGTPTKPQYSNPGSA